MQSRNFVYRIFKFEIYSFVIGIARDVNRAVLDEITIPAPGLIKAIEKLPTADEAPTRISVIISNIFFLFKFLYFFSYYSLSLLRLF